MALFITENCIQCDMCEPECPNKAITNNYGSYSINPVSCTECEGFYSRPHCQQVCPIKDAIKYNILNK